MDREPFKKGRPLLTGLCRLNEANSSFETTEYSKFLVKRGLRNPDGTGIVAGLTKICNVHGYIMNEGERSPIDGRLIYRGFDLYDLVNGFLSESRFGFDEVAYLLLSGALPDRRELSDFKAMLAENGEFPDGFIQDVLRMPYRDPMNVLARSVLALYSYDERAEDQSIENVMRQSVSIIAAAAKIVPITYAAKQSDIDRKVLKFYQYDPERCFAENILMMLRPGRQYTEAEARLLDLCLTIHADHGGGNNSTFAVRVLTSASTDSYSAIAAGIGSLKGFRHGGANHKVSAMLDCISKNVHDINNEDEVGQFLEKIVDKKAADGSGLIYGIGHAVYTLSDPRAVLLKKALSGVAAETEYEREFKLAMLIEKLAPGILKRKQGSELQFCANVDLYSGIAYKTLGIPEELFTPMFCIARIVGWCAHRIEELISPGGKIIRPAYKSVQPEKAYIPLSER